MKKETALIVLGISVALVPYLGIPWNFKTYALVAFGFLTSIIGVVMRYKSNVREKNNLVENSLFDHTQSSPPKHEQDKV
jgi:hypothetical protein